MRVFFQLGLYTILQKQLLLKNILKRSWHMPVKVWSAQTLMQKVCKNIRLIKWEKMPLIGCSIDLIISSLCSTTFVHCAIVHLMHFYSTLVYICSGLISNLWDKSLTVSSVYQKVYLCILLIPMWFINKIK